MMPNPIRSVFTLPVGSRTMIEANAGTGKTYAIVGLFVRLLLEKRLEVNDILVVTFTRKATSELRDRIFARLQECLDFLSQTPPESMARMAENDFQRELAGFVSGAIQADTSLPDDQSSPCHSNQRVSDASSSGMITQCVEVLKKAVRNFDEAQIFTIHGFCQRILSEEAFLSGSPLDPEVSQKDEALVLASEDYWRSFIHENGNSQAGRYRIKTLLSIAESPKVLRETIKPLLFKEYDLIEGKPENGLSDHLETILSIKEKMNIEWHGSKREILQALEESDLKRYSANLGKWADDMDVFLDGGDLKPHSSMKYFSWKPICDSRKKNGPEPVEHRFFHLAGEYIIKAENLHLVETNLLYKAFRAIQKRREHITAQSAILTYDDLLIRVRDAISHGQMKDRLIDKLKEKFRFALVDEFQDTDRIQYAIFRSIWPQEHSGHRGLFMIGDPKQAIYGFRGAEIFTYLQARQDCMGEFFSLENNYRSSPALVEVVNEFCSFAEQPFQISNIPYFKSGGAMEHLNEYYQIGGSGVPAFRLVGLQGLYKNKENARQEAIRQTVYEIACRLDRASRGEVRIGKEMADDGQEGRTLQAGDIAVLVHEHRDAEDIKRALRKVGIGAVTYSREKVFESQQAGQLERLMSGILEPYNHRKLSSALLSGFFGDDLGELQIIFEKAGERQLLIEKFEKLKKSWIKKGFASMLYQLLYEEQAISNLAKQFDGERVITNVLHLSDICSQAETKGALEPHALHGWFCREMSEPDQDDEKTLLLESDQNLVKLSTIHNSKGLQFPVVICPSLWQGVRNRSSRRVVEYHQEKSQNKKFEAVACIAQGASEIRKKALVKQRQEEIAEEVRKAYVAITRAKYQCTVIWITHKDSHTSGLGAMLTGASPGRECETGGSGKVNNNGNENLKEKGAGEDNLNERENSNELSEDTYPIIFRKLAKKCDGSLEWVEQQAARQWTKQLERSDGTASDLTTRQYRGPDLLVPRLQLDSFSTLSRKDAGAEEPDYDQHVERYAESLAGSAEWDWNIDMFGFPRGAVAGTAVHKLFEHPDFDFSKAEGTAVFSLVEEVLSSYGIDLKWVPAARQMMLEVAACRAEGLAMNRIQIQDQIRELEFHFLCKRAESDFLYHLIRCDGVSNSDFSGMTKTGMIQKHSKFLTADHPDGIMNGYVDLVVRQNGKFYIVDYKSNYLGNRLADYDPEKIRQAMLASGYDLQYHIYLVALCAYLRKRIRDFDYERDIGGVAYLFVRGIRKGSNGGIFFDKPLKAKMDRLQKVLLREHGDRAISYQKA